MSEDYPSDERILDLVYRVQRGVDSVAGVIRTAAREATEKLRNDLADAKNVEDQLQAQADAEADGCAIYKARAEKAEAALASVGEMLRVTATPDQAMRFNAILDRAASEKEKP